MRRLMIFLMAVVAVSCSTGRHLARVGHSPHFAMDMYTPIRNYTVLQVYDKNFCLAVDDAPIQPTVIAITLSDREGPVYEGQKLRGLYVMIDTYTYETKGNTVRTVPLVTPIRDYEDMQYTDKMLEKSKRRAAKRAKEKEWQREYDIRGRL